MWTFLRAMALRRKQSGCLRRFCGVRRITHPRLKNFWTLCSELAMTGALPSLPRNSKESTKSMAISRAWNASVNCGAGSSVLLGSLMRKWPWRQIRPQPETLRRLPSQPKKLCRSFPSRPIPLQYKKQRHPRFLPVCPHRRSLGSQPSRFTKWICPTSGRHSWSKELPPKRLPPFRHRLPALRPAKLPNFTFRWMRQRPRNRHRLRRYRRLHPTLQKKRSNSFQLKKAARKSCRLSRKVRPLLKPNRFRRLNSIRNTSLSFRPSPNRNRQNSRREPPSRQSSPNPPSTLLPPIDFSRIWRMKLINWEWTSCPHLFPNRRRRNMRRRPQQKRKRLRRLASTNR